MGRSISKIFATTVAVSSLLALTACTSSELGNNNTPAPGATDNATPGELLYSGFGGSYEDSIKEAIFEPFTAETGITFKIDTDGSNVAKLQETIKAGKVSPDLVDTEDRTLYQFIQGEMLQKLDSSLLDLSDVAYPELVTEYRVPWYQFSRNLFWNKDVFGEDGPQTWAEVWDVEKFPGKRILPSGGAGVLEAALLADGVALDELYPIDMDRAFASLDKIKPHLVVSSQADVPIAQGEVVAGLHTLGRIRNIIDGGVNLGYSWNGAAVSVQALTISANAENATDAHKLIQFALRPEVQQQVLDRLMYTPTVRSVLDALPAEQLADLPGTDATRDVSYYIDGEWWAENAAEASKRWEAWLNS